MLHHNKVPNVIINPNAAKKIKPQMKATAALKKAIVKLKLAGVCSVEIAEKTGATDSNIQTAWKEYRKEHPEAAHVPKGNRRKVLTNAAMVDIVDPSDLA
jgi:hypothetical protein